MCEGGLVDLNCVLCIEYCEDGKKILFFYVVVLGFRISFIFYFFMYRVVILDILL